MSRPASLSAFFDTIHASDGRAPAGRFSQFAGNPHRRPAKRKRHTELPEDGCWSVAYAGSARCPEDCDIETLFRCRCIGGCNASRRPGKGSRRCRHPALTQLLEILQCRCHKIGRAGGEWRLQSIRRMAFRLFGVSRRFSPFFRLRLGLNVSCVAPSAIRRYNAEASSR